MFAVTLLLPLFCALPGLCLQGAGGNGNVLKEIVDPAGAAYDIRKVRLVSCVRYDDIVGIVTSVAGATNDVGGVL